MRLLLLCTLLLLLSSCNVEQALKPNLTEKIILQVSIKDSSKTIEKVMLERSCEVLKRRLDALNYKQVRINIINDTQIQILLPKILNKKFEETLISNETIGFHLVHSEPNSGDMYELLKEIDSVQDAKSEFDEVLNNRESYKDFKFSDIDYTPYIPEHKINSLLQLMNEEYVQQHMKTTKILWGHEPYRDHKGKIKRNSFGEQTRELYHLSRTPEVSGESVETAEYSLSPYNNMHTILIQFTPEGSKKFARLTRRNIGRSVAIVLNNEVISAPNIREAIVGNASISGNFTKEEAQRLAIIIGSGKLPYRFEVVEKTTISHNVTPE